MAHMSQKNLELDITKICECSQYHIILKVSPQATCWPSFITLLPINSVWNNIEMDFFNFQDSTVTLTFGQGHPISHHFEELLTGYLLAKFYTYTFNK